jgi:hypothetical protein
MPWVSWGWGTSAAFFLNKVKYQERKKEASHNGCDGRCQSLEKEVLFLPLNRNLLRE